MTAMPIIELRPGDKVYQIEVHQTSVDPRGSMSWSVAEATVSWASYHRVVLINATDGFVNKDYRYSALGRDFSRTPLEALRHHHNLAVWHREVMLDQLKKIDDELAWFEDAIKALS